MSQQTFAILHQNILKTQSAEKRDRDQGTNFLQSLVLDENTVNILTQYISQQDPSIQEYCQQMAAIQIKNIVKRVYGSAQNYEDYDDKQQLPKEDQVEIDSLSTQQGISLLQSRLVDLLLNSQSQNKSKLVQALLEIISILARRYVQEVWPELLQNLINILQSCQDLKVYKIVFDVMKKVCKKYRHMQRSDALYTEMNYVIENFSEHLIRVMTLCINSAQEAGNNFDALTDLYTVLNAIFHIIESILAQEELPDFYEEQIPTIIQASKFVLSQDYIKIPDQVYKARGKVVSLITLYNFKFYEYFLNSSDDAFEAIWNMIDQGKLTSNKNCEKLAIKVMKYIGELLYSQPARIQFLKDNLNKIFQLLIMPNISITQQEIEEFDDDPAAYIQNDLEEGNTESRRSYCMKFVQRLSKKFQQEVSSLIANYIEALQAQYQANKNEHWGKMTSLLNLIWTATVNQYSFRSGVYEISISEEHLWHYIQNLVIPELQDQNKNHLPILKATAIKFVYFFRNQLPDIHTVDFIGLVGNFLSAESPVLQSYSAAVIEKLLMKKDKVIGKSIVTKDNIDPDVLSSMLSSLCALLNENKNLYAIRALFRVIQMSQEKVQPFGQQLGQVLSTFIMDAAKQENDPDPNYIYILFETTTLTIKNLSIGNSQNNHTMVQEFQDSISASLNFVIENNKTEMIGFAFQVYSLFVASQPQGSPISQLYRLLLESCLMNQDNWTIQMKYLMPSLGDFINVMICKYTDFFKQNYLSALGQVINTTLQTNIRMESVGLQLANTVIERMGFFDPDFFKQLFFQIFTSLHFYKNSTNKKIIPVAVIRSVFSFFATFIINAGGVNGLLQICDQIQPGILFMILKSEAEKLKFAGTNEREKKYVLVAFSTLIQEQFSNLEIDTVKIIIENLMNLVTRGANSAASRFQLASTIEGSVEEMLQENIGDKSVVFSRQTHIQLNSAKIDQLDSLQGKIDNPEMFALQKLVMISKEQNQPFASLFNSQQTTSQAMSLCQQAGIMA